MTESEWRTRRERINTKLRASTPAWEIVRYKEGLNTSALARHAVEEFPTENGPADYALFVKGQLLGIIEAKKIAVAPQNVLEQAKRYARGANGGPGNWDGSAQGRVPVLRMGNLQNGEIDWNDLAFTSDRGEIEKYKLAPMTVLFNRTNSPELVGKSAIYRGERPAIFAGYLIRVNHEQELLPEYLNYCLSSADARAWCRAVKTDGVRQSNISAQKLAKYEIPFCSLEEQQEIVRRAGLLFGHAKAIEIRYRKALAYTSRLMPAAIEKAYRGELLVTS